MDKTAMLDKYLSLLLEYNSHTNLTAVREPDEIKIRHFEDSAALLNITDFNNKSLLDVDSGAGYPGLPLKIANPSIKLTLLEATGKKAEFLKTVVRELALTDVSVINERAEDYAHTGARETFDIVTARGVAHFSLLSEICLPFVRTGGYFLAMKTDSHEKAKLSELGGELCSIRRYTLSNGIGHCVITVKKTAQTPEKYPRPWGIAKKRPLI